MEDFLQNTIKECGTFKASHVKQSAQEAYDLLCSQNSLLRTPSHELRAACFKPIKGCLESKKSKLLSLGLSGLAKIIRDERFQAGSEPEDDSLWLPSQLLHATSSMLTHCDDTQVHILRCVLSMACASSWALNGRLVMLLIGRCGEAYECGTQPVRAAAQAAASQTLTAFCTFLDEECQEILQQQAKHRNSGSSAEMVYNKTSAVACFNEAIPVMQYICSKLEEMKIVPKTNEVIVFLLECLLTLVGALPPSVHSNTHFTTFLWQRFCPALLALLGAPGDPTDPGLSTHQAKIVYSIGIQVVRLVGRERALRPVLEALFHRMLLLPAPSKRLEPLRAAKELLRSPGRLADLLLLTGPIYRHAGDDMAIIRLIMDSIEESAACSDIGVLLASVECVCALLGSLESMCATGEGMNAEAAEVANGRYVTLDQADYTGPLTYQSLARLPKPYRDVVANLKYESDSEDSSGIEGGARDVDDGDESDASGATEGPEEYDAGVDDDDEDDSIMDDESFLTNQQLQKLHNIPKSLHLGRTGIDECNTDMERHNARHFVKTLQNILLPNLLTLRSSIQIDEVLQEFASKCCEHNAAQAYDMVTPIVNADGIYLATYAALLLNLRLMRKGHYRNQDQSQNTESSHGDSEMTTVIMTEAQFVDEIHGSGVLVYVSATWLCELYQNVLAKSLLEIAGYDPKSMQQPALISLLTDVGGLCPSQQLTDWQKLQRVHQGQLETTVEAEAGVKLARRVLTCCWQSVVAVLSAGLGEPTPVVGAVSVAATSSLGRLVARRGRQKLKQRLRDDVITASLEGLQKAASLSNTLKLQTRSSSILGLLSSSACSQSPSAPGTTTGPKLLAAHALSLDVLLSKGLDLAVHSQQCWAHVFSACVAVSALEHALFSRTGAAQLLMVTAQSKQKQNQVTSTTYNTSSSGTDDKLDKNCLEEETVDVYSFLQTNNPFYNCNVSQSGSTNTNSSSETTVGEIVERSGVLNTSRGSGLLTGVHAAKVCCVLSSKADELFHNASQRLSLPALLKFLTELCKASHLQLFSSHSSLGAYAPSQPHSNFGFLGTRRPWWRRTSKEPSHKPPVSLLLFRIGEVTLKCIRSGRPLIHTMKIWSIVGPHFMEAACHKDREVSKKAIAAIHDVITCVLNDQSELSHFHFNEALFKPFENLLCLEICDQDVLDQIVASLCEFVEANSAEINSGWRPLFATLRSTAPSWGGSSQVLPMAGSGANAILDIFYIFLQTDNTLVFANAALDYILCLLAHVKVAATCGNTDIEDLDKSNDTIGRRKHDVSMSQECLKLIESCSKILAAMYTMPKCPRFNLTHRMSIETAPQIVDTCLPNENIQNCSKILCSEDANGNHSITSLQSSPVNYKLLALEDDLKAQISLREMDAKKGSNGLLKVWYILIEGLTANLHLAGPSGGAQGVQGGQAEMLFKILKGILPIRNFAFYCINHLLLPTMQIWLRRNVKTMTTVPSTEPTSPKFTTTTVKNQNTDNLWIHFKHCIGMTVELVVEYISVSATNSDRADTLTQPQKTSGSCVDLALKQLLILLIEIISTEEECVAILGVSCVRHLLLALGQNLTTRQWEILTLAIHRACTVTLGPLTQLTKAFKAHSDSFYGDLATVKVAARKANDNLPKVYELGSQVFLMTAQRSTSYHFQQHVDNRSVYAQTPNNNPPNGKISPSFAKLNQAQNINSQNVGNSVKTYQNSQTAPNEEATSPTTPTDDRSYVFLLYPMDMASVTSPDLFTLRVPFKNLVVGLLAHQLLMQTISSALLHNLRHVTPILQILHVTSNLGGTLRRVDARHIYLLLKCLDFTNERAKEFDLRPGLKFLVQKVGNLPRAANLYTLANTSEVVQIIVLIELALDGIDKYHLTSGEIKKLLDMEVADKDGYLYTDLDYVEEFLRQLRRKWESLCESYARLTFAGDDDDRDEGDFRERNEEPEEQHEAEEAPKRRSSLSSSDSCASYLERDVLPDYHPRENTWEDKVLTSTDDETNEMAAKIKKPVVGPPTPPASTPPKLSYDTNTLLQMTLRHQSSQFLSTPFITSQITPGALTKSAIEVKPKRANPFDSQPATNALPPPQPVPPEIQQQRSHSIEEDFDAFRQTRIETMEACLELLSSLSAQKLAPLAAILKDGAVVLAQTGTTQEDKVKRTAEDVLKRMNLQFDV